jgi:hypothetical protein
VIEHFHVGLFVSSERNTSTQWINHRAGLNAGHCGEEGRISSGIELRVPRLAVRSLVAALTEVYRLSCQSDVLRFGQFFPSETHCTVAENVHLHTRQQADVRCN